MDESGIRRKGTQFLVGREGQRSRCHSREVGSRCMDDGANAARKCEMCNRHGREAGEQNTSDGTRRVIEQTIRRLS